GELIGGYYVEILKQVLDNKEIKLKDITISRSVTPVNIAAEFAFDTGHYDEERKYWQNRLAGKIVRSNFPTKGRQRASIETVAGRSRSGNVEISLTGEVYDRLMKLSGDSGPKMHMVMTAALTVLLGKYTGNEDILIGTPIYKVEVEGEFINTVLPIRNRVEASTTFKEMLVQTRQIIMEADKNANYPMEKLLYHLNLQVSETEFPLFAVALLLENIQD
ncbi:MAG: hypothetical protein GY765_01580, partial [bacterium]|nr:hypothetical protein [bacterium]